MSMFNLWCCCGPGDREVQEAIPSPEAFDALWERSCHQDRKTIAQRAWILEVVQTSPVFLHTATDKVDMTVDAFKGPLMVPKGTAVIKQGEFVEGSGPGLFVLEQGSADAYVVKASGEAPGSQVYAFDTPGQTFGHLALLYDCPRTATVIMRSDAVLWHLDRDTFHKGINFQRCADIVSRQSQRLSRVGILPRSLTSEFAVFDINLTDDPGRQKNIAGYYALARESNDIIVTLSCFGPWAKAKKTNACAKVIPAVKASSPDPVRIFFFDDNIELDGKATSSGICNLRDIETGQFVEFGEGANGFQRARAATNSVVCYSTEYRNVLIQADILDAMEDELYFEKIVAQYAKPGDKIIIFMDVNSTVISVDTVSGKDMSHILLCTLLDRIKATPRKGEAFTFQWDSFPPMKVDKPMSFKSLAKKYFEEEKEFYNHFYTMDNCMRLLESVSALADVKWSQEGKAPYSLETFKSEYDHYLVSLVGGTTKEGITTSWFQFVNHLKGSDHCLVINSFGVDTRKLLVKTVDDERQVLQLAVSFKHWDARDVKAFEKMYGVALRAPPEICTGLASPRPPSPTENP